MTTEINKYIHGVLYSVGEWFKQHFFFLILELKLPVASFWRKTKHTSLIQIQGIFICKLCCSKANLDVLLSIYSNNKRPLQLSESHQWAGSRAMEPWCMQMCDSDGNRVLENVFQRHLKPRECFHLRSALFQSFWVRSLPLQTMNNSESCSFRAGMCRLRGSFWKETVAWHRECPCGWSLKQLSSGEPCQVHSTGVVPRLLEPREANPGYQITEEWATMGNTCFCQHYSMQFKAVRVSFLLEVGWH